MRLDQGSTAGCSASARLTARFGPLKRDARLSLPRKLKGPIMASTPSGIWGMSAHSAPTIEQDLIALPAEPGESGSTSVMREVDILT